MGTRKIIRSCAMAPLAALLLFATSGAGAAQSAPKLKGAPWQRIKERAEDKHGGVVDQDGEEIVYKGKNTRDPKHPKGLTWEAADGTIIVLINTERIYKKGGRAVWEYHELYGNNLYYECLVECTLIHELFHVRGCGGGWRTDSEGHIAIAYTMCEVLCDAAREEEDTAEDPNSSQAEADAASQRKDAYCDYIANEREKYWNEQEAANHWAENGDEANVWPASLPPVPNVP